MSEHDERDKDGGLDQSAGETDVRAGRYQVLTLLCISAAVAYVQRAALSVPAEEIASDLKFANLAKDMGAIQSAWYLAYALMQVPSGWLADRLGSRSALVIFTVAWSMATLLSAFANGFYSLLFLWGLWVRRKLERFLVLQKRWVGFSQRQNERGQRGCWQPV